MNLRSLFIVVFALLLVAIVSGQVPLENPVPQPAPVTSVPPPPPPPEPQTSNPIGLLILAVVLAHVCLPLSLLMMVIVLLVCFKLFRGGLTKFVMGLAAAGGAKGLKGILTTLGCLVVLPAGFMGLNWAVRWLDYPVPGATRWIYALVVSVVTGWVFFTLMKAVVRAAKQKLMGRMGAGLMGQFGGQGMKQARGKTRRR
jgi:hypothetical protein